MTEPREWKAIGTGGVEWYVRDREPAEDELALGYAQGTEGEKNILVQKGVMQDIRESHFYIIGAHGTGKSKFMERLIAQDLQHEKGFGVIDPQRDLFEEVRSMLALSSLDVESRVVVIDPTDEEYSVCFNPLELPEGVEASEQAKQLVLAFKKLYKESWGQRLEAILRNVLIVLIENGLTLRDFTFVMRDNALRKKLLRNVKNEICQEYFKYDFDRWSEHERIVWTQSTTNKIDDFLTDGRLARIFSSTKSSFDLRDIIENGKILLVKLNDARLGTGGEILGSLLLTKLQLASMSRDDQDHDERRPFYLYIDEFQNFATDSFLDIINETRKYKLALTFAHQNLEQLSSGLRASVPNCGLQGYFRMNRPDAERLAKESLTGVSGLPETWEDRYAILQNLGEGVYVCKNKSTGGAAVLQVLLPTRTSRKILKEDGDEEAHRRYKSMGADYLRLHEDIDNEYRTRRAALLGEHEPEEYKVRRRS